MIDWKKYVASYWHIALVVIVAGVVSGMIWAVIEDRTPSTVESPGSNDQIPTFGELFSTFFLGLPGSDVKYPYPATAPLRESKSFVTRQRVGIRIQTNEGVSSRTPIELRVVTADNKEETPQLAGLRQRFTIQPGLRTYCCLTMPDTPQHVDVRIIYDGHFIGDLKNIQISRPLH